MEIEIRVFDILLVSAAHTVARGNTEVLETFLESKRNKKQSPPHFCPAVCSTTTWPWGVVGRSV